MKRLLCAAILMIGSPAVRPAGAVTPETVSEYFSAPVQGMGLQFKAQAVRVQNPSGVIWKMKLRTGLALGRFTAAEMFSLEDANHLLNACKNLLNLRDLAKASPADMYEKRIGINDSWDVMYRFDKQDEGGKEYFWLIAPTANLDEGLEMERDAFDALIKTVQIALNRAEKGK